jgi:hypothetical protein
MVEDGPKTDTNGSAELAVSREGLKAKVNTDFAREMTRSAGSFWDRLMPDSSARIRIKQAATSRISEKIANGDAFDDRDRAFMMMFFGREMEKYRRRIEVAEQAEVMHRGLLASGPVVADRDPDPDVVERLLDDAAETSHDEVRDLYARLLAGEVAKPGSVSKRLLAVLKNMSPAEARAFQQLGNFMLRDVATNMGFIPNVGIDFIGRHLPQGLIDEFSALGLITNERCLRVSSEHPIVAAYHGRRIKVWGPSEGRGGMPMTIFFALTLMKIGAELMNIIVTSPADGYLEFLAAYEPHGAEPWRFKILDEAESKQ